MMGCAKNVCSTPFAAANWLVTVICRAAEIAINITVSCYFLTGNCCDLQERKMSSFTIVCMILERNRSIIRDVLVFYQQYSMSFVSNRATFFFFFVCVCVCVCQRVLTLNSHTRKDPIRVEQDIDCPSVC